jgi:nitrite reductase/ring-hydroxylating ferredoxin subunit
MKWIKVTSGMPENNRITKVKVANKNICLVMHEKELRAFTSNCPHAGADLSHGWCNKGYLVCPVHRYQYNLENGRGAEGQGDYLKIYPTEIRTDGIYIGLEKPWWSFFARFFKEN